MQRCNVNQKLISVVAAAIVILCSPYLGASNQETSGLAIREQLRATYRAIVAARRSEEWDPEEEGRIKTKFRELTTGYVLMRLNRDGPPPPALSEQELNEAFA